MFWKILREHPLTLGSLSYVDIVLESRSYFSLLLLCPSLKRPKEVQIVSLSPHRRSRCTTLHIRHASAPGNSAKLDIV